MERGYRQSPCVERISSEGISSQSTHHPPLNPHFESRFHFALNPLQKCHSVHCSNATNTRLSLPNTHPLVSLSIFMHIYIYLNGILYINGIYKLQQIVCCIISCYIHVIPLSPSGMLIILRMYNVCACMPIAQATCVYYIYIYAR